jgi:hypothetical protein
MVAVPKLAAKYNSPPHAIPTAADNHNDAAVVRPCTMGVESLPSELCCSFLKINPAPKNPTPLGMAAETLEASHVMGPCKKAKVDVMVNKQEPNETNDMVRIPAGLERKENSMEMKITT